MLKKILLILAVLVVGFVIVAALQPPTYQVARSTTIAAPPAVVFAQVNDLHKFQTWSPWAKLDPAAKYTYGGPPAGVGAVFNWAGNSKVGEGRMEITESRPHELVRIKLDFIEPFASTAMTDYTFKSENNQTTVTWSMAGNQNFMSKAFGLIMSMDKMIGQDFEKGLANLKSVAESAK